MQPYRELVGAPACPRCQSAMFHARYGGTSLLECASCGAHFVEERALALVLDDAMLRLELTQLLPFRPRFQESAVRYVHCPHCERPMNRHLFRRMSGVIVDSCKAHGTYFDAGELAAVLAFVNDGGLERVRQREREEAAERARNEHGERSLDAGFPAFEDQGGSFLTKGHRGDIDLGALLQWLRQWWQS